MLSTKQSSMATWVTLSIEVYLRYVDVLRIVTMRLCNLYEGTEVVRKYCSVILPYVRTYEYPSPTSYSHCPLALLGHTTKPERSLRLLRSLVTLMFLSTDSYCRTPHYADSLLACLPLTRWVTDIMLQDYRRKLVAEPHCQNSRDM